MLACISLQFHIVYSESIYGTNVECMLTEFCIILDIFTITTQLAGEVLCDTWS